MDKLLRFCIIFFSCSFFVQFSFSNTMTIKIDVATFGAKGDGKTNDSQAFQKAIDFLSSKGGGTLIANGEFRVDNQINLKSDIFYNFEKAIFYKGKNIDYLMKGDIGTNNIHILGGAFQKAKFTPTTIQATGEYVYNNAIHIAKSSKIIIEKTNFTGYFVSCDFYDCQNVTIRETNHFDCNAGIAIIASSNAVNDVKNIKINNNSFFGTGDDAIAIGPVNSNFNIRNVDISFNYFDKYRTSILSAVGIRVGRYGNGAGKVFDVKILNNYFYDMTDHSLYIHDVESCDIENNVIDKFAKRTGSAAIVLGGIDRNCDKLIIKNNTVKNPSLNGYAIYAIGIKNSIISNNYFEANNKNVPTVHIEKSRNNTLSSNTFINYSGATLQLFDGSDNIRIEKNNLSNGVGKKVNFGNSKNIKATGNTY